MRALLVIFALSLPAALPAATLLAKLKPATVNLGNSATLTLHCVRGQPATVDPSRTPRNLALTFVSSGRDTLGLNGVELPTKVFIYKVTPKVAGQFAVLPSEQVGQFDPSSGIVVIGSLAADLVQVFGGKLRECFDPGTTLDEVFGEGLFRDIELFGERSDGECFGWYEPMG